MSSDPAIRLSTRLTSQQAAQLAHSHGLREMGVRPSLKRYLGMVWERRSFIWNLSASKAYTRNQGSYLGQAWNIIRPILDAAVFIIIFGFVLNAAGGYNRMAFITIGVFVYTFFGIAVMSGAGSIPANLTLIRSHQFPRAVVPLSTTLTEIVLFLPVVVVMVVLSYITGLMPDMGAINPAWSWLTLPAGVLLFAIFGSGLGMIFARLSARTPDVMNIIPFFIRLAQFASAVMFLPEQSVRQGGWLYHTLINQPVRVFIELFRGAIGHVNTLPFDAQLWWTAAAWAVGTFTIGFVFFWGAEEVYGRD